MKSETPIPFIDIGRFYGKHKEAITAIGIKVFSSGRLMDGENTKACELKLAELYSYTDAVMTGSCTDALYFALIANGISPGDEVIITSFSFIGSVTPIIRAGGIPVFVDVDPFTGLMNIDKLETKIGEKTRAIIAVHIYGQLLDMERINQIAGRHHLIVVEDAAQSIGAIPDYDKSKKSECICISFDPTKVVHAIGSGGAVICDKNEVAERIREIRYHGKSGKDFLINGFNSRISEHQAALILYQLNLLDSLIEERKRIAKRYIGLLSDLDQISLPKSNSLTNFHKFVIQSPERDNLKQYLSDCGIQTMIHYQSPLFEYSVVKNALYKADGIILTPIFCLKVLSLPMYNYMTDDDIEYICESIKFFYLAK